MLTSVLLLVAAMPSVPASGPVETLLVTRVPYAGPVPFTLAAPRVPPRLPDMSQATAIDTGPVSCFDVAADSSGRVWAAVAYPDRAVGLYYSDDFGVTWRGHWAVRADSAVRQLKLVTTRGRDARLHLFLLEAGNGGDLWLARVRPDSASADLLPVAVGPDTVDDFSAAADCDERYYLYCLFVNEHRSGPTGVFTRSLDLGLTWESGVSWFNAWDPCLYYGGGTDVHCAWRYAVNGAEIHYTFNRHYAAPGFWQWYRVVNASGDKAFTPVIARLDTYPDWKAWVWVFYATGRRDTSVLDLAYSISWDGGWSWAPGVTFGSSFHDEWRPCLAADPAGSAVSLVYNYSDTRSHDSVLVYWSHVNPFDPNWWLDPVPAVAGPVSPEEGVTPRLVYSPRSPLRLPAVVYSRPSVTGPSGVYFALPWSSAGRAPSLDSIGPACTPNPGSGLLRLQFTAPVTGSYRLTVLNLSGRVVARLLDAQLGAGEHAVRWDATGVPAGAYFALLAGPNTRSRTRLVLLR